MSTIYRSQPKYLFLAKVWVPLLSVASAFFIFGKAFPSWRFLPAIPFLLAALFGVSVASLEVTDDGLRYRRLFKWKTIHLEEVSSVRLEWPPVLGSLRLKRLLFPWGRLYFVLDANIDQNPFHKGEYPLFLYLRDHSIPKSREPEKSTAREDRNARLKLLIAAMTGVIAQLLLQLAGVYLFPRSSEPSYPREQGLSYALQYPIRLLGNSDALIFLFVLFTLLALYRYRHASSPIFAFLAGGALFDLLRRWM